MSWKHICESKEDAIKFEKLMISEYFPYIIEPLPYIKKFPVVLDCCEISSGIMRIVEIENEENCIRQEKKK